MSSHAHSAWHVAPGFAWLTIQRPGIEHLLIDAMQISKGCQVLALPSICSLGSKPRHCLLVVTILTTALMLTVIIEAPLNLV